MTSEQEVGTSDQGVTRNDGSGPATSSVSHVGASAAPSDAAARTASTDAAASAVASDTAARTASSDVPANAAPGSPSEPIPEQRSARPILFLDVDGPLNPYAAPDEDHPAGYGTHRMRPASWAEDYPPVRLPGGVERIPTLRVWLNPAHGKALLNLPVELVWATTWEHEANEWIGPHLDLPELPVVAWNEHDIVYGPDDGTFWKTHPVAGYAAGRPFAWFDDQIEPADIRWCEENYPAPTLLLPIDPAVGLREADFDAVARWAREL